MINIKYLGTILVCILLAFFFLRKTTARPQKVFIQAWSESGMFNSIIKQATPVVNGIIKKELALPEDDPFEFFLPKKEQRVTLYEVAQLHEHGFKKLFEVINGLQDSFDKLVGSSVQVVPHVSFFGGTVNDELVVMINDVDGTLAHLHQELKESMNRANSDYKMVRKASLYDIKKSERHAYTPHMGIGRLRSASIKQKMKDPSSFEIVFKRIQERTIKAVTDIVQATLLEQSPTINFVSVCIFDLETRQCLEKYPLY
jgi:hypothetical protein